VDSNETIKKYCQVGEIEQEFLNRYLPGPVTLILPLKDEYLSQFVSEAVGEKNGVGWRVIDRDYARAICRAVGEPIILTSANKTGAGVIEATSNYVRRELADSMGEIDYFIDGGDLGPNAPSAVIDLTKTPFSIVRHGHGIVI
jgi:L-threonylcarbamoyladenylate synthase